MKFIELFEKPLGETELDPLLAAMGAFAGGAALAGGALAIQDLIGWASEKLANYREARHEHLFAKALSDAGITIEVMKALHITPWVKYGNFPFVVSTQHNLSGNHFSDIHQAVDYVKSIAIPLMGKTQPQVHEDRKCGEQCHKCGGPCTLRHDMVNPNSPHVCHSCDSLGSGQDPDAEMADDIRQAALRSRTAGPYYVHQLIGALTQILHKHSYHKSGEALQAASDQVGAVGP